MPSSPLRRLTVLAALLVGLALLTASYGAYRLRALDTPEGKAALLERASAALGAQLRAGEVEVSLLRGVGLRQVAVANPSGFPGELLSAEAFRLRYDLLKLLRGRLQVDELALERPALRLAMDARGVFNYQRLGAGNVRPSAAPAGLARLPVELRLSRVSLQEAQVSVVDHTRTPLLTMTGLELESSLGLSGGETTGTGEARVATLALADRLFLRRVSTPLALGGGQVRLAPIRGTLAGGPATGTLQLDLARGFGYVLGLELAGSRVETLLQEAGARSGLAGSLRAKASLEGSGGLLTATGRGSASVADCRLQGSKVLAAVAAALLLPELADPDFDECRAEFALARGRAEVPALSLKGPSVQLTGRGSTGLASGTLDYDMTLALAQSLLERIPVKELRSAFHDRGDSFATLAFRLTGSTDAPRTDIAARVARAGARELLKGALGKLFRGKRP